jgi:hypothetical protein
MRLGRAIIEYDHARGKLPAVGDSARLPRPLISWRVLVLPYADHDHIYYRYNGREAWNGATNYPVVRDLGIELYQSTFRHEGVATSCFAIVGSETAWGDGTRKSLDEVTDDKSSTLLLIQDFGRGVHWAEPKDLTFDEAIDLLTTEPAPNNLDGHRANDGYFYKPRYFRYAVTCNGNPITIPLPLSHHAAVALLTANGNEPFEVESLWRASTPQLDYARVWAFSVFVVLALLPAEAGLRPWILPRIVGGRSPGGHPEPSEGESPGKTASSYPDKTDS